MTRLASRFTMLGVPIRFRRSQCRLARTSFALAALALSLEAATAAAQQMPLAVAAGSRLTRGTVDGQKEEDACQTMEVGRVGRIEDETLATLVVRPCYGNTAHASEATVRCRVDEKETVINVI